MSSEIAKVKINKVIIYNPVNYHYECIESVIHFLPKILANCEIGPRPDIILNILTCEQGFIKYITNYTSRLMERYSLGSIQIIGVEDLNGQPQIIMPSSAKEARIILTIPNEYAIKTINEHTQPWTYVILHRYMPSRPISPNIFYLAPHCGNQSQYFIPVILPFSPESVSYIDRTPREEPRSLNLLVQGACNRRDKKELQILIDLVKIGNQKAKHANRPPINLYILTRTKSVTFLNHPNIIVKVNTDFWEFNQIASQSDIILPLVSKQKFKVYYVSSLTSSISYGLGYKMKFIVDSKLADIYQLDNDISYKYSSSAELRHKLISVFKKHIESNTILTESNTILTESNTI